MPNDERLKPSFDEKFTRADATRIAYDLGTLRSLLEPADHEKALRLVVFDYAMSELAYCPAQDLGHVGVFLGYDRKIGAQVYVNDNRGWTSQCGSKLHFAVISLMAEEILQGSIDAFRDRLRNVPGADAYASQLKKEGKVTCAEEDAAGIRALFKEASEAIDEMVVSFREGVLPKDTKSAVLQEVVAASADESWPDIPILRISCRDYVMRWGLAMLRRSEVAARNVADADLAERLRILVEEAGDSYAAHRSLEDERLKLGGLKGAYSVEGVETGKKLVRAACMIGASWGFSGFPVLRPTHKLAASLMATHIPRDLVGEVKMPWPIVVVEVPNGLVPVEYGPAGSYPFVTTHVGLMRMGNGGYALFYFKEHACVMPYIACFLDSLADLTDGQDAREKLLRRLLLNAIIETDRPLLREEIGKGRPVGRPAGKPEGKKHKDKRKKQKDESVTVGAWNIVLRRDVKLDVRGWVTEYVKGGGKSPLVQTLVRGHQKRQPYGPNHSLRKWIHIEAYWRGPEDAPVVVRSTVLAEQRPVVDTSEGEA
jgi:hypothetical protein